MGSYLISIFGNWSTILLGIVATHEPLSMTSAAARRTPQNVTRDGCAGSQSAIVAFKPILAAAAGSSGT